MPFTGSLTYINISQASASLRRGKIKTVNFYDYVCLCAERETIFDRGKKFYWLISFPVNLSSTSPFTYLMAGVIACFFDNSEVYFKLHYVKSLYL